MIQELLKDKKKIGISAILIIVMIVLGITYLKSGFKELKKNDTENIFVDDTESINTSVKESNSKKESDNNTDKRAETVQPKDKRIVVEIKGEVKKPDVYMLDENSIIKDLIEAAGGLTENADLNNINRAKKLQDHDLIYIANKNEIVNGTQNVNQSSNNNENESKKVNINNATLEELKTIKGIGDAKAKSIIEYREQNGGFKTIEDIKKVTGIGEKMFETIKEQIET
ncbi:competence protein ComEA helix-hairpin-helix repeat protein [Clostridium sp. DL-VIII]|uniref:helix-hairpin-helix domain-containing protein n=1 Tax=Clostridium sp. DL-VIII TaxID=641107 RepID=UPI00023B0581|nr:helix-hairpin-helix domain-containing protein [Clostridium sp. DL-VIII]EHJ01995.1 competence protein ComEA helix-hairpin-helix repeat protein [Clostridium sp. DL-VIII]